MKLVVSGLICILIMIMACEKKVEQHDVRSFLDVNGGKIWYRVIGAGIKTPVVILHGGPGSSSYYLTPFEKLDSDRKVILFDQLGCGRSDRISDTTLMTIDNHIDQINKLTAALGIDQFHLYGHSWGSMLATDYYLRHPEKVKALVLASPCLSAAMWVSDADSLISMLPDTTEAILRQSMTKDAPDSARLAQALAVYSSNYYSRKQPAPWVDSTNLHTGINVYRYMWGNNEFFATGTLKNYDRTTQLSGIKVPVLYTTGEYDAAAPSTVRYYQSLTPGAQMVVIKDAGHNTLNDNEEQDLNAVRDFLQQADSR